MPLKRAALIMAGGQGERFWPKSRRNLPIQFLSLTGTGKTMIQLTVERVLAVVDSIEDVYISTNLNYRDLVIDQLPAIPERNILCEPVGRNTAPCIGLGASYIAKKYGDAVMFVFPSDHLIRNVGLFAETVDNAAKIAEAGENLVTLGMTPTYPETGYGYIKFNSFQQRIGGFAVDKFVEKPVIEKAVKYVKSGEYLWNSGIFVWKVSVILSKLERFVPDTYRCLNVIKSAIGTRAEATVLAEEFPKTDSISIDYAVLEKSDDIFTVKADFDWNDVGSWLALERIQKADNDGNIFDGDVLAVQSKNTIVQGTKRLVALVGMENVIVVDSDDAILICDKQHTEHIKDLISTMKASNRVEL